MKEELGRWQRRLWSAPPRGRRTGPDHLSSRGSGAVVVEPAPPAVGPLDARISKAALAFRGYDVANLGRSRELLRHERYGPIVREVLEEVSAVASDALGRTVDVADRIDRDRGSTLATFADDVALIVGMELAQVRLLDACFGLAPDRARLALGYSIGELTATIVGGVFALDQLLPVPLALADDCAALAVDTTMGVLFSRGPALDEDAVARVCRAISAEGKGLIGPSAYLAPNTALVLAEGDTLDRLEAGLPEHFPGRVMLRRNENRWPPLHSPIVWRRNIPNRAATAMYAIEGGSERPRPPIVSCVSGGEDYGPDTSRDLMIRWTDQPQRLWDAIDATLNAGVDTIIHVGPAPNLIPATFARLGSNVAKHVHNKYLQRIGHELVTTMTRHPWLAHALPANACLLRIPFIEHIILEDWLLAQPVA